MLEIHCHRCGGFISNPAGTTYREAPAAALPMSPHTGLCVCGDAVVYGPAPESAAGEPGGPSGVHRIRSASRN